MRRSLYLPPSHCPLSYLPTSRSESPYAPTVSLHGSAFALLSASDIDVLLDSLPMNNPRSIFTDIRYTSKYSQSGTEIQRPEPRRSLSDSISISRLPGQAHQSTPLGQLQKEASVAALEADVHIPVHGPAPAYPTREAQIFSSPPSDPTNPLVELAISRQSTPSEPARKRRRKEESPRFTDRSFRNRSHTVEPGVPPSPLFFSNSPNSRPPLPPRFSSSEAAARMLSKTQGEDKSVKTVKLARGTAAPTRSPTMPSQPLGSRRLSSENSITRTQSRSPDTGDRLDPSRLLVRIGITELLHHDLRPTFVVDLGNSSSYGSDGLQILYANPAFHSQPDLLDRCTGSSINTPSTSHVDSPRPQRSIKSWILGLNASGEPAENQTPALVDGDMLWSASTLRRRLRVISGVALAESGTELQSQQAPESTPSTRGLAERRSTFAEPSIDHTKNFKDPAEAEDYFGSASVDIARTTDDGPQLVGLHPAVEKNDSPDTSGSRTNGEGNGHHVASQSFPADHFERFPAEEVLSAACAGNIDLQSAGEKDIGFFDWTRLPPSDALPKHIQFARGVDWGATALGPIESWSADLRQMCNLIMASPHPAAMYWGEDLVAIYNEAYVLLAGQKHPELMGQSYREAWAEIWDDVKEVFANAQTTGQATMKDDDCLFLNRNNFLEETYFSWSIIPMVGGDGSVMGLYNPAFEKTRRKIAERRMLTLREIGERTAAARDVSSFWEEVLAALECNEFDTPFVLLYSLEPASDSEEGSLHSNSASGLGSRLCVLEGALGVPLGHVAAPSTEELQGTKGFVPIFREVMKTNKPMVLDVAAGEIPTQLLEGLEVRGFSDAVQSVVVCPIHPTTGESTLGFLVMGVNPRRPFDEDYNLFVQLLSRQLATSLASVVLFEEEIKRGQQAARLAALDRIELSEQLAARTQEAIDSETKFTRMAEFIPVGVFIGSSEGMITYCNDSWFDISRVPAGQTDKWTEYVIDEDRDLVEQLWQDLVRDTRPATAEFRFKTPWTDRNGVKGPTWVIFSAYPEKNTDGTLKSVFGSITNISQQKWAEGLQKRKMEEAVELKRQQENFIDITSHEMRNPLSAILQCSDEIVLSLGKARAKLQDGADVSVYNDNIDAAHTIALCAQHQKRIVDDVLTLSKLDSALLMVTPVDVQPVTVAQRALKMFEGELQNADIEMKFIVDQSFEDLQVDWCRFDPSRVLQVLINLTTNAIKFTTTESKRTITITVAVSRQRFSEGFQPVVSFFPRRSKSQDKTNGPDWGDGEEIYVQFAVQDTGRGLTAEEKKLLFMRFSQASPRTHVQYGGSGLGLFISRELTELQGGEIGVASEAGKGSTFAFFVRARKSSPPTIPAEQLAGAQGRRLVESKKVVHREPRGPERDVTAASRAASDDKSRKDLRVLIVEDNLVNQRVLQKQLKNLGCITHVANHGGEALDRLRESWFWSGNGANALELDVVLMDQEMPVMDGLTCTTKIRELEQEGKMRRHVPVIAVTANARVEQIQTAMNAGMDDVVSKPFRIPDLIPKIEELVAKYSEPDDSRKA